MAEPGARLTVEQELIAFAPPATKMLVTADAGTGKTQALLGRLAYLVDEHDVMPGRELLILSFSRAAVREIRKRVKQAGGGVSYVRAQTFDSFATRLLSSVDEGGSWTQQSFDGRIAAATEMLRVNDEAREELSSYVHILVDETQDLVGVRMEFVKTILDVTECGFTLFGDPAQGIYNFQESGEARRIGSRALYGWVRIRFGKDLVERTLHHNFRAETEEARKALFAGPALNSKDPDYERIRFDLDHLIDGLQTLGTIEKAFPFLRNFTKSTAILCRTNGQALVVSKQLFGAGIPHVYQRSQTDRVLPGWIAEVFRGFEAMTMTKGSFERRLQMLGRDDLDVSSCWGVLKRMDGRPGDSLDLARLNERIRIGAVPDELNEGPSGELVVSTIHRAKGLEFDRVVLVEPKDAEDVREEDFAEEVRLLYVGLSRPKRHLIHVSAPKTRGLRVRRDVRDRWIRKGFKKWQTFEVEVRGEDVESARPAGDFLLNVDPIETQEYLSAKVRPGDGVRLRYISASVEGQTRAFYAVEHEGRDIGITSEAFGGDLFRILKISRTWDVTWPPFLDGLHIENVDSVVGTPAAGRRTGIGPCGLWLRPRVFGLGRLSWNGGTA